MAIQISCLYTAGGFSDLVLPKPACLGLAHIRTFWVTGDETMRMQQNNRYRIHHPRREEGLKFLLTAWPLERVRPQMERAVAGGMRIDSLVEACIEDPERWDSLQ